MKITGSSFRTDPKCSDNLSSSEGKSQNPSWRNDFHPI